MVFILFTIFCKSIFSNFSIISCIAPVIHFLNTKKSHIQNNRKNTKQCRQGANWKKSAFIRHYKQIYSNFRKQKKKRKEEEEKESGKEGGREGKKKDQWSEKKKGMKKRESKPKIKWNKWG